MPQESAAQRRPEYANDLAVRAAERQDHSAGFVPSEFDDWLAKRRAKGGARSEVASFPAGDEFRPSPSLPRVG